MNQNKSYKSQKYFNKFEPKSMVPNINIYWKKAKGFYVWDKNNKKYIDFTSTIFVSNIGHSNPKLIKKIKDVLKNPISHSYVYYNKYRQEYVSKLIKFVNQKKLNQCFFMSSGTESTEVALKLIRLNGLKQSKEKKGIICLSGNWHGRTMGAQLLSDNQDQSKWITTKDKDIFHIDFPYPWIKGYDKKGFFTNSIKKKFNKNFKFDKKISGIMLEAFQGWGSLFYPKNYIDELKLFAKKNKILIAMDEMQSGFARTGKKFCFEHYNFVPDIVCCGKGMGSGVPISGIITSKKIMSIPNANLQSTHSGNPLSCAAGSATIDEINRLNLVTKTDEKGKIFKKHLDNFAVKYSNIIKCVTGKGLIGAIIFKSIKKIDAKEIADKISMNCFNKNLLLVNTGRDSIKFGPPLTITSKVLNQSMIILENSIKKFLNENSKKL